MSAQPALRLVTSSDDRGDDPDHLEEWQTHGIVAGWSPMTFRTRLGALDLLRREAGVPLIEVSVRQLAVFIASRPGPWTKSTYYRSAVSYYRWLKKMGYRDDDPTEVVPRPKVPKNAPRPVGHRARQDVRLPPATRSIGGKPVPLIGIAPTDLCDQRVQRDYRLNATFPQHPQCAGFHIAQRHVWTYPGGSAWAG